MYKLSVLCTSFIFIFFSSNIYGQITGVGIGTDSPRSTLDVAGDVVISKKLDLVVKDPLTDDDDSTFLIQNGINEVKTLDVGNLSGAALGYIQKYVIVNPQGDWISDFDTKVSSLEFVMISISAFFDRELIITGSEGATNNASAPYTSAIIKNGTWHLIADFPVVSNRNASQIGTWTFTTIIYSKDLSKQFGTINIPMANATTGAATNPIIN